MNTLRAKIIALVIGSISVVIMLATAVTVIVLGVPNEDRLTDTAARQTIAAFDLTQSINEPRSNPLGTKPDVAESLGDPDPILTSRLRKALANRGFTVPVTVRRSVDRSPDRATIVLADGRTFSFPIGLGPPPFSPLLALGGWIAIVLAGTTIVAVFAANRVIRPLGMLRNITAAISPEHPIPTIRVEGPAEVRAAALAINSLGERLRGAMESRMRLVAAAGHDFRTPLTRMRLRAEFMADDEERSRWLRDIEELDQIADSAILLVREEVSATVGEIIALDTLIAGLIAELHDLNLTLTAGSLQPITIRAQPLAVRRALRNLLVNAATYGKAGHVQLAGTRDEAIILIEDDGPGIPEDMLDRVFEPFFRVDLARQKPVAGAGLGLAIANEIIQRHHGTLDISNRASGGLRQTITFPRNLDVVDESSVDLPDLSRQ